MFFKKLFAKAPEQQPEESAKAGFFGGNALGQKPKRNDVIAAAVKQSIQVDTKDLKALKADGTAMDSSIGMDASFGKLGGGYLGYNYGGIPEALVQWYGNQSFIGYQLCAIIAQHWLVDKACTLPAKDAVRNGFEITVNDGKEIKPEVFDAIRELNKEFKLMNIMREQVRQGRIFGIRHTLFHVDSTDPDYYAKPFNIDAVTPGSYKGMSQIDPYWLAPQLDMESASNPFVRSFYEPTWWIINGKRFHRSHFVIMITNEVPDVLKPTYFYGGVSVSQKIYERVYNSERTANEAPLLTMTKRLTSLKLDVTAALADEQQFIERMEQWTSIRNNLGVKIIGEGEELNQQDTALGDLDNVIMTQYQLVAAIAETPATRLLGTQPKGFNSTGEFEEASYHETLESIQEHDLTPLVERHLQLLMKSVITPEYNVTFEPGIAWNPLDAPTADEIADINVKKSTAALNWINAGAIDGMDERQRLIGDPTSGYNGIEEQMPEPEMPEEGDDKPATAAGGASKEDDGDIGEANKKTR